MAHQGGGDDVDVNVFIMPGFSLESTRAKGIFPATNREQP